MSVRVLTDDDVRRLLDMPEAIEVMEAAFRKHAAGALIAPARKGIDLQAGELMFTPGATLEEQGVIGFRVYDMAQLRSPKRSELTVVFDTQSGALKGVVVGPLLGAMRTGAIGGVAIKYLSNPDSRVLGMIGTGGQARTQLPAALVVREFETINVFSRNSEKRERFATEMREITGREICVCESAREVAESADVLVCSTVSPDPVIEASWLKPGVHINNVGPKFKNSCEIEFSVIESAALLVTDSRSQVEGFGENFILHKTPHYKRLTLLGDILAQKQAGRGSEQDITLFHSVGLAGTEVLLADHLLEKQPG